jgi:hypothetical protein
VAWLPVVLLAWGCEGSPPETLGGFGLGLTQSELMEEARLRGGWGCRLRASRPPLTICEGPVEEGTVTVTIEGDSARSVRLRMAPDPDDDPGRAVRRWAGDFGTPLWRDRPYPPRSDPPTGYHTYWANEDSTRSLALVCAGREMAPPCTAELERASPVRVRATLDSLLGITR